MGQEILYCNKCGHRLVTDDFTRGRAHTFNSRQYCSKCLPQDISTGRHPAIKERQEVSTASHRAIKDKPRDLSTASHRAIKDKPGSRTKMRPGTTRTIPAAPKSNLIPIVVGVVAVAIVLVVIIFAVTSSKTVDPPPATVTKPAPPPDVTRTVPPKVDPARIADELKELEGKVQSLLQNEQFGGAIDLLGEARKRRDTPDWTQTIGRRIQEVEALPAKLYPELRQKASAAQLRGAMTEVQPLRARVVAWARKELLDDFDRMIAETVPHEPLPPGAVVLVQYPNPDRTKYTPFGEQKPSGLVGLERFGGPSIGFESGRDILVVPREGEVRLVFTTTNPTVLTVILRTTTSDGKNYPFNFWLKNPEVGKPQLLKCPIAQFKNWTNDLIVPGGGVNNIYVRQETGAGTLTVHEFVIFRTKD